MGIRAFVLDGDSIRQTLSEDLGFSPEDRAENIRRVARVAQILMDAGIIALVALVSPFAKDRLAARELFADDDFAEVFVDTPLEVCEQRDPKGLYVQARASESTQMTGISQKYEAPEECEFHLDGTKSIEENAAILREWVLRRRF
jgi:bifunctional enzyme CysN/CysC